MKGIGEAQTCLYGESVLRQEDLVVGQLLSLHGEGKCSHFVLYLWHLAKANTIAQSQVNIEKHYDLG